MNTTTATRTCNLHNVKDCATCHKYAGQCDFGACRKTATQHVAPENRPSCARHAADMARNY
jgi:hypothetical protein